METCPLNSKIKSMTGKEALEFKIKNADRIFRTAVNDSFSKTPKDNIFRRMFSKNGLAKIVYNAEEVLFAVSKLKNFNGSLLPADTIGDIWTDIGINNLHNEGGVQFQNGKKPLKLIDRVLKLATDKNSIVLDSFAGSGTTAHAVLNLNAEDGGNRKFILVEMEDYAEKITAERVRRVGGSFGFYEVGEPIFDDEGELNKNVDIEQLREYIWYSETRTKYEKISTENKYYLGEYKGTGIYFNYEKNSPTYLDIDFLSTIKIRAEN